MNCNLFQWPLFLLAGLCWLTLPAMSADTAKPASRPPNIIFILADDLGYGDLGCYGQKMIRTPVLDRLAAEGMRFPQFYAGSTVCAPSRSVLMTGQHLGHTRVRGNAGKERPEAQMLQSSDMTVAKMLKQAGYATGLVGKWGLGYAGSDGVPTKQGFDYFFGFLDQGHAHNHYPDFLWRNETKVSLPNQIIPIGTSGAGYATNRVQYAGDLFNQEALHFVEQNQAKPFFLYYAVTVPHANNERTRALGDGQEVPDYGPYQKEDWTNPHKGQAAMITRLDADIGRLMELLKKLGLDHQTLILFSSDNGPHKEGGNDPQFFKASGPLKGIKRSLTDGGIRVPFIAHWPSQIKAGVISPHVGYFGDFMATAAELAGLQAPAGIDSLSLVPTFLGQESRQKQHEYLYWEFFERGFNQATVIQGRWKGIRLSNQSAPIEIYDLQTDLGENQDLAKAKPELVNKVREIFNSARTESPLWPIPKGK
jgi:arylsulfatase A-like enzyme